MTKDSKKKKVIWEQYALYATLFLMVAMGAVFAPKREAAPVSTVTHDVVPVEPIGYKADEEPQRRLMVTKCGEKERPDPLLLWPNPVLKSHIAEFEKETSSFLERSKFKNGVSVVFVREFCPEASTQFSFHFPEKRLVASLPEEATHQYQTWVVDAIEELKNAKAIHPGSLDLFAELQKELRENGAMLVTPSQPEWGGVQISFRR